jgi:hypothetical protein
MSTIKVLVKHPGKEPEVQEMETSLDAMQAIVGGSIELVPLSEESELDIYLNEEGKIEGLPFNIQYQPDDIIVGTLFVVRSGENGSDVSLTDEDIAFATKWLQERAL